MSRYTPPTLQLTIARAWSDDLQRSVFAVAFGFEETEDSLDVSCLLEGEASPEQGVILAPDGSLREGAEGDAADLWPDDGEWFWSWESLAKKYARQLARA